MIVGRLDRKIVIQSLTTSVDTFGGEVTTPVTYKTVWAKVEQVSASERVVSDGLHSTRASKFTIRYLSGVTELMQIVYDNRTWRITGIAEIGRRVGLEILAEAMS